MSRGRCWCSVTVVVVTSLMTGLMTGCGDDPPNKEIQQAQQAVEIARALGAEKYAADEFTAAQDALTRARANVVSKDYRQALNDALDARDRAQTASKDAGDRKAAAKASVDTTLHNAALAIIDARARLRLAEGLRRPRALTLALRREIADAELRVQEARAAFDKGDYLESGDMLTKSMQRLTEAQAALNGTAPPAAKRR